MSQDNRDNLPSYNDFIENKDDLPSINEFIGKNDLPSVQNYLSEQVEQKEEVVEEIEEETAPLDLTEVVRLINDVRRDIPKIPEIKYYDEELEKICEEIIRIKNEIPEVKYYDEEIELISEKLSQVRDYIDNSISELPEVKYYDDQVQSLEYKLLHLKNDVLELPEVRYYENDINSLREEVEKVRSEIPEFPSWINEVNEVPDFSWIGKTFSIIDDDFTKVNDKIGTLKEKISFDLDTLSESLDTKSFENKVDIQNLGTIFEKEKNKIWKELSESSLRIWEYHKEFKDDDKKLKKQIKGEYNTLKQNIEEQLEKFNNQSIETDKLLLKYFSELKEEVSNLPEVRYYEDNIKSIEEEVDSIRGDVKFVKGDVKSLTKEIYKLAEEIKTTQKELNENYLLNEPSTVKQSVGGQADPLTPTGEKFATFKDLEQHYRIFLNRIQVQLSTMGGGGAGFIKDLDDVEFDQTTGNNKLLIYDQARSKWVGIASTALGSGGPVGAAGTWSVDSVGIHTTKNVGIGTTSAKANVSLYVIGNAEITGNISVAGTITYDDVTNVDSIGIITARSGIRVLAGGINAVGVVTASSFVGNLTGNADTSTYSTSAGISTNVIGGIASVSQLTVSNIYHTGIATFGASNGIGTVTVGFGNTALYVDGDARVTGILTVGKASVTIDGDGNTIRVGDVFITGSSVNIGDNVTINTGSSGINSAPNVIYVAKDGNDSKNGTSIDNAKLTIAAAVGIATTGTIIKVLAGNYLENNPIEVPPFVSIVGDDLKTVTVTPNIANKDLFHVRKGCYIANMTFTNHVAPAAAIGFPTTEIATNVGGGKWESPYIQNCTSNTTTGTGLRIDGSRAEGLRSIVCDSYTQYNQGGIGVAVTNGGYAQLVSVFTICCNEGITAYKGGQCSLTNSNTDFGTYGLVSDGIGDLQFTGLVTTLASSGTGVITIGLSTTTRPYEGQVVYFDTLYYTVESITVTDGGSGYTSAPTVSISAPTGPNGITATAFATLNGDKVSEIIIISSGNQYASAPSVTISAPDSGSTATASANISPIYYTINSSTPVTSGITTLTLDENLNNTIGIASTAYFYQVSRITASSHTFEYVGSGNDITTATPLRGGVPVQENEIVTRNGGRVVYTSTDQAGNFRIGNDIVINQNTGTISGRAFTRSLFNQMTPFILALS